MKISKENTDKLNATLSLIIEKEDYEEKVDQALKDLRKKVDLKGFRKGMVPTGLIKKMYGTSVLVEEVNKLISNHLYKYLVDEKIDILGDPIPSEKQKAIDWENQTEYEFIFDLGLNPEFELKFDDDKKLNYYKIKVDQAMIDNRLDSLKNTYGEYKEEESVSEESMIRADFVELDLEGQAKENGTNYEGVSFLMNRIAEDLRNDFIGKKVDDQFEIEIRKYFTNEADLAGMLHVSKDKVKNIGEKYQLTIKEISKYVAAEVNEDLYNKAFPELDIQNEEDLKKQLSEEIAKDLLLESEYKFIMDAKDFMIQELKPELPVEFLKRWLEATNEKLSREEIERDWPHFEADLQWQLIKNKIAKEKSIKVNEEDLLDMAKQVTLGQFRQYGISYLPENELEKFAKTLLEKEEQREKIYQSKFDEKVNSELKEYIKFEEKELSQEEFGKLLNPEPEIKTEELKLEDHPEDHPAEKTED